MMRIEEFVGRLSHATRTSKGYLARCPAHDDTRASLAVDRGQDGRLLVHCFAGCAVEAIVEALGCTLRDLMGDAPPSPSRVVHAGDRFGPGPRDTHEPLNGVRDDESWKGWLGASRELFDPAKMAANGDRESARTRVAFATLMLDHITADTPITLNLIRAVAEAHRIPLEEACQITHDLNLGVRRPEWLM